MLLSCTVCIVIYSCHKDSKVIPADYYFKANKNNIGWGTVGSTATLPGDSLQLSGLWAGGGEHIFFKIKFKDTGSYPVTLNQAAFFTTDASGNQTSYYRVDTTRNNMITIKSYNTKTRIISGIFQLSVLKNSNDPNEYVPIDFSGGVFRVKLPD
ncbi:DUF6252 family protein [Mucilaginibacter xinganensis]|nr:DUF6252 family protein [Mucilaginibacter xinganensis]